MRIRRTDPSPSSDNPEELAVLSAVQNERLKIISSIAFGNNERATGFFEQARPKNRSEQILRHPNL